MSSEEAVAVYGAFGGHLTRPTEYGLDPLRGSPQLLQRREELFQRRFPNMQSVYGHLVNGNSKSYDYIRPNHSTD